uniref:Uncharacterized protein n=1 Tax=Pipistrellus kuhlii TaxID=59472 RepID=A0A7J8A7S9_PIPKU|nr:hypothetical protein mPipKuh1_008983 [Pipistrellus kuhlii]
MHEICTPCSPACPSSSSQPQIHVNVIRKVIRNIIWMAVWLFGLVSILALYYIGFCQFSSIDKKYLIFGHFSDINLKINIFLKHIDISLSPSPMSLIIYCYHFKVVTISCNSMASIHSEVL